MTKKVVISFFATILALVALGALQLSRNIDKNKAALRTYLIKQLSELSSEPVSIKGDLTWQLFPKPSLRVDDIAIGHAKTRDQYFLKLASLGLNLKLWPLLGGRVVFDKINANKFDLIVYKNQPLPTHAKSTANSPAQSNTNSRFNSVIDFAINQLNLTHGTVQWMNADNQALLLLDKLTLQATDINLQDKLFYFRLTSNLTANTANKQTVRGSLKFHGQTHLNRSFLEHLDNLTITGQLTGHNFDYNNKVFVKKLAADVQLKNSLISFNPLILSLYQSDTAGELHYNLATQQLSLKQSANDLNSESLSQDLLGMKLITGGALDFSIKTTLDLKSPFRQSAVGYINIKNGALEGFNLDQLISILSDKLFNLFADKTFDINKTANDLVIDYKAVHKGNTAFKLITIPYKLTNHHLQSDAIVMQTNTLKLQGDGQINLSDNAIAGHAQATVKTNNQTVNKVQTTLGGYFPLTISGSVNKPVVLPDFYKINPIITRIMITDTLSKPLNKVKEQFKQFLNVL